MPRTRDLDGPSQASDVQQALKQTQDACEYERLLAVQMGQETDLSTQEIAHLLGRGHATLER